MAHTSPPGSDNVLARRYSRRRRAQVGNGGGRKDHRSHLRVLAEGVTNPRAAQVGRTPTDPRMCCKLAEATPASPAGHVGRRLRGSGPEASPRGGGASAGRHARLAAPPRVGSRGRGAI